MPISPTFETGRDIAAEYKLCGSVA